MGINSYTDTETLYFPLIMFKFTTINGSSNKIKEEILSTSVYIYIRYVNEKERDV